MCIMNEYDIYQGGKDKMYQIKKIAVIFLCAAMVCSFTGCGNKKDTATSDKTHTSSNVISSNSEEPNNSEDIGSSEKDENVSDDVSSDASEEENSSSEESDENDISDVSSEDTLSEETDESSESESTEEDSSASSEDNVSDDEENYESDSDETGEEEDSYQTDRYIPTVEDKEESVDEADKEQETKTKDWDGPEGYVIVIPENNQLCNEAATTLKTWFKENAKIDLKVVTDSAKVQEKEIVVGKTNRYNFKADDGEYFAKLSGKKLIFGGGHDVTAKKAVEIYTRMKYEKGKVYTFSGKSDFTGKKLGYTYVWGDEFETKTLDKTRWNRATKMGATAEMTLDDTELTTKTENGYLKMFALRYWDPKKAGVEYTVPWSVTTMETMSYRYGYVEIRAKVPFIRGVWPSFWTSSAGALNNTDYTEKYGYSIEVDVFEVFSSLDKLSPNIHKWYGDGRHTMWAVDQGNSNEWYQFQSDNLVNEYHTYGFEWTPTKMVMYIDDEPYYTYDLTVNFDEGETGMGGYEAPLYLIFNNHLFTDSSDYKPYDGCEIKSTDLPAEYFIDWVRLYQKNDGKSQLNLGK